MQGAMVMTFIIHMMFSHTSLPMMVLCFEKNGHIAIEFDHSLVPCHADHALTGTLSTKILSAYEAQRGCVDLPVSFYCDDAFKVQKKDHQFSKTAAHNSVKSISAQIVSGIKINAPANISSSFFHIHLKSIQTIQLLI